MRATKLLANRAMSAIGVGDRAPSFSAKDEQGNAVSLDDFLGKSVVVLFFYPKNGTPVCTREACGFRDAYEEFVAAGAEVVGVSAGSSDNNRKFAESRQLPYHLIDDSSGAMRRLFGVRKTLGVVPGRVTFVIDRQGVVQLAFSALLASDAHVQQALEVVRRLNSENA